MDKKPFDKVAEWSIQAFLVAAVGLIAGFFCHLMMFVIPKSWHFWYGFNHFLYIIGIWAFRIFTPVFVILAIIALVGGLIYRITHG